MTTGHSALMAVHRLATADETVSGSLDSLTNSGFRPARQHREPRLVCL
jgi:hypothetical protein